MKLSAQKFATALWAIAVAVVILQWVGFYLIFDDVGVHIRPFTPPQEIFISLLNNLVYGGALAALGAMVHLLGEIRDQLARAR